MPDEHARLSPSAAHRWLTCPASLQLVERLELDTFNESDAAAEGTAAHALGEIEVRHAIGRISTEQYADELAAWVAGAEADGWDVEEIQHYIEGYVAHVQDAAERHPNSVVLVEQRMPTGLPQSFGTSDIVIVSPQHVEIIDLKYGSGVKVEALRNPQLRLYACGAMDSFAELLGETEVIRLTIYQPRLHNTSSEELTPGELRAWREWALPIAEEALFGDNPRFGPSEKACRWCPAAGVCKPRMERMTAFAFGEDPDTIPDAELGDVLSMASEIKDWVNKVEDASLHKALHQGAQIPGWKVVYSNGRRQITDPTKAIELLVAAGHPREAVVNEKIAGLGDLDKVVGKHRVDGKLVSRLGDVLGDLVVKGQGNPSLVPDTDSRPFVDPNAEAAAVFSAEE